jgi:hypothetical protein
MNKKISIINSIINFFYLKTRRNDLREIFYKHNKNLINKWDHYLDIYDKYFSKYRGLDVKILEIGISQGGSLQMWRKYFGSRAEIYAIDINPECGKLSDSGADIFIGSQENRDFLKKIKSKIPKLDIIIDDGGHMMNQQIITFEEMFNHVKDGGVYICEDLHTSYWSEFGGGYKKNNTFIEYSKNFIDYLNAWHSRDIEKLNVNNFTKSFKAIHYYDSVIVIEKDAVNPPKKVKVGVKVIEDMVFDSDNICK